MDTIVFASHRHGWQTPPEVFEPLDAEFHFELDAAASHGAQRCARYISPETDALEVPWQARSVWLNPPYGRGIGAWVRKAFETSRAGAVVVVLVPARPDTRWWAEWALKAAEIRFVQGRIRFVGAPSGAPFPSAVLIFDEARRRPIYREVRYGLSS